MEENSVKNTCLIVEGGGFKTGFTAGVLDAFIASRYKPFNRYIGISGGAVSTSYFLSNQYRYCLKAILLLAKDENFTNFKRSFGEQGYMDIDFISQVANKKVKFEINKAREIARKTPVHFVATNKFTGRAAYLEAESSSWIDSVIASSTLPFVTKGKHTIGEVDYFDGGWSDPLPVKWAVKQGAKKILVIRTWPKKRRTKQSWSDYFASIYYNAMPNLKQVFEKAFLQYNESVEFMESPPKGVIIEQIAPSKILKSTTYTYSKKTIMSDYRYGVDLGLQYVTDHFTHA